MGGRKRLLSRYGLTSRIGYWLLFLMPLRTVVVASPRYGALIWGSYGFIRLGAVSLLAYKMHRMPTQMAELSAKLLSLRPKAEKVTRAASLAFAAILAIVFGS